MGKPPIGMLSVPHIPGCELGALWDGGALGIKHWRELSRMAVTLFNPGAEHAGA